MNMSPMRISGLATGLNTDDIISQLMQVERTPLNKLFQKRQLLQWQQENYRDLNSKLLALRNQVFNMKLEGTYKQYSVISSKESVVTATATATANPVSYVFDEITSLAKSSSIATANGENISQKAAVITGGAISKVNTDNNNTFKINFDNLGFVDVTLDDGKKYDGFTPGGTVKDFINDIQTKLNTALLTQGVAENTVLVSLTSGGNIQFTTTDTQVGGAPKTIVLQEGDKKDLLKVSLGFATDSTTKQISSTTQKMDLDESLYINGLQNRFSNQDFGWTVNGTDKQTVTDLPTGSITSTVDYNNTNINNYLVTTIEDYTTTVEDNPENIINTSINFNSSNVANIRVSVGESRYKAVVGKKVSDLSYDEVLVSDDGTGKIKLSFKNQIDVGKDVHANMYTKYNVVTDKTREQLAAGEVLLEDDGTGKANFTFKDDLAVDTVVNVDRHDFDFTTTVYNQDGEPVNTTFNINAMNESMNSLINKINNHRTVGVSAFYDTTADKIIFNATKTGDNTEGQDILLSGNFLRSTLKISDTAYSNGSDAVFKINGVATFRKENTFTINGTSFTLKGTTTASEPITVSIIHDVQKVFNAVKGFVEKYNETIGEINTRLTEKREREYTPLTKEQKDEMKENDIKLWEEKAKSGLLKGDLILSNAVNNLRKALYTPVQGVSNSKYKQLTEIGITTSIYQDRGKLIIDDAKLMDAIKEDPNAVMQLFSNVSTATDSTQKYNESGLAVRLYDNLTNAMAHLTSKAGQTGSFSLYDSSTIGKEIERLGKSISGWEEKLFNKETNYYKKFAALESAINKMNAQSTWLNQQLGGIQY